MAKEMDEKKKKILNKLVKKATKQKVKDGKEELGEKEDKKESAAEEAAEEDEEDGAGGPGKIKKMFGGKGCGKGGPGALDSGMDDDGGKWTKIKKKIKIVKEK